MNARAASSGTPIKLASPGKGLYVGLVLIFALAPALVVALSLGGLDGMEAEKLPAQLALLLAIEAPILLGLGWISTRRRATLGPTWLDIRATFYRKHIALSEVDFDRARVVDLGEKRELRPRLKTNGFALPGFAAGHFRDAGGHKLFCLVTRPRVVWLPLTDGSRVLLSASHPAGALDLLRKRSET